MRTKKAVQVQPLHQLSLMFEEDRRLMGTPADLLRCIGQPMALDTETTGLKWWEDDLLGLGVHCPKLGVNVFIPTAHDPVRRRELEEAVRTVARDPRSRPIFHNAKFDLHFLNLDQHHAAWELYDTTVLAHLFDSRLPKSLAELERTFLGTETKAAYKKEHVLPADMPWGTMAEYCLNDCAKTYALAQTLVPAIKKLELMDLFRQQMEYLGLLQKVERVGMLVDLEFLNRAEARFISNLGKMEEELFTKSKQRFDWHSPQQMAHAMYEGMGIEKPVDPFAGKDGVYSGNLTRLRYNSTSTSSFILMEKAKHPLGPLVMDLRETDILLETVQKWKGLVDRHGVIHTSFNLTGTRTGRLSSSNPNLQNVAGKERVRETQSVYSGGTVREDEYNLREAFIARPGNVLVSEDFKQQEMRLFAIQAQEPEMLEALRRREDIHSMIARSVWGKDIEADPSCLPVRREWSKTISFGLLYGMRPASLEMRLDMPRAEAMKIAEQYWTRFTRIMPFLKENGAKVAKDGFIRLWSGRIWRENDPNKMYKATNALMQGGGAELLSRAAQKMDAHLEGLGYGNIVNFVHDELLLELPADLWLEQVPTLSHLMEMEEVFGVPFVTDVKVGPSYGGMVKLPQWLAAHPVNGGGDGQPAVAL